MGARPSSFIKAAEVQEPTRDWTQEQFNIFQWFAIGANVSDNWRDVGSLTKNLVVRARPGTGKTTTIGEGVNRAPEDRILVGAFSRTTRDQMDIITNPNVEKYTAHGLGMRAIGRHWRRIPIVNGNKRADSLTDMVCPPDTPKPIKRLVSLLHTKGRDMLPLTADSATMTDLALFFDLVPDQGWAKYDMNYVVERALAAMKYAAEEPPTYDIGVDFADMIYLPLRWDLLQREYGLAVGDESQDFTKAQLTMLQRVVVPDGRICIVGDDKQAIFGFRGADSASLDRLKGELQAGELSLTYSFRCCQKVVRRAQRLVPDFKAFETNPEGVDDAATYAEMLAQAKEGDFILSRLNAPLVVTTLKLLRANKRARMAGRDIGKGIRDILYRLGTYTTPLLEILRKLDDWERRQTTKLASMGRLDLVDRVRDQADMIRFFAEVSEDTADMFNRIEWLFVDENDENNDTFIICSSVHKAKGLEAERVFLLQESFYRRGVSEEEKNIEFVAMTRAKNHLTIVTGAPGL